MFGRRPRIDPEVVAAARRRLEALTAEGGFPVEGTAPAEPEAEAGSAEAEGFAADDIAADGVPESSPRHLGRPLPVGVRLVDRVRDAVPTGVRGRAGIASQHVTVIALVIACAVAVGAWLALRSTPKTVTMPAVAGVVTPTDFAGVAGASPPAAGFGPTPTPGSTATLQPSTTSTTADTTAATIVVDVAGRVRRPGIVELSAGARVVDAIDAAGGARPRVDLSDLNLARPLVDGEQILVGVPPVTWPSAPTASVTSSSTATSPVAPVNLNTASQAELESLPGVGPVTATAILAWRTDHGAFTSVDELLEVSGIGDATLADLAPLVTV